jgi:hypothetical protein
VPSALNIADAGSLLVSSAPFKFFKEVEFD